VIYFITVNYYSAELIAQLIASFQQQAVNGRGGSQDSPDLVLSDSARPYSNEPFSYQLLIVNNSPDDPDIHKLSSPQAIILEAGENLGFGQGCNLGLDWVYSQSKDAIVWLINPDATFVCQEFYEVIHFFKNHSTISILGTLVTTLEGDICFAGGEFNASSGAIVQKNLLSDSKESVVFCDWVSGCSMILNLQNFQSCPRFDSSYFLYYEDFEFCYRYRTQGHQVAITSQFEVNHRPSSITNRDVFSKTRHSTYSYLITLHRLSPRSALLIRLAKLLLHTIILVPYRPPVSLGKCCGVFDYLGLLWRSKGVLPLLL
jgi:N-acetylglucosaminyl-diphospho-decaprenol L-rhamnosyltransferase